MAPKGAVIKIATTATDKTICPQGNPSASGTEPMAACTVAFGMYAIIQNSRSFRFRRVPKQAQKHAKSTKDEGNCNHCYGGNTCRYGITNIHRRSHHNEQDNFRRQPELTKFSRQSFRDKGRAFQFQRTSHGYNGQQSGHRNIRLQPGFQSD